MTLIGQALGQASASERRPRSLHFFFSLVVNFFSPANNESDKPAAVAAGFGAKNPLQPVTDIHLVSVVLSADIILNYSKRKNIIDNLAFLFFFSRPKVLSFEKCAIILFLSNHIFGPVIVAHKLFFK